MMSPYKNSKNDKVDQECWSVICLPSIVFKRFSRACSLPYSHNVVRHHHGFTDGVSVSFESMVHREYLTSKSKSAMNKLYSANREVKDQRHDQHDTNKIESINIG